MTMENQPCGPRTTLAERVDKLASQCVKCALCLPYCPTYELTEDENESPRGRISLFQALSNEMLPLTNKAQQHLDQCLGCRACERVCPAHVEYGELLISGRTLLNELPHTHPIKKRPFTSRLISWMVRHPHIQTFLHWIIWGIDVTGIRRFAKILKVTALLKLQRLDTLLPPINKPVSIPSYLKALTNKQGTIMLFKGCITNWCDLQTLDASIFVLRKFGFDVVIPSSQTCCGAMALHAGETPQAYQVAQQNLRAFGNEIENIVTFATGCSAVLQEYAQHFSLQSNQEKENTKQPLENFSNKIVDIMAFIEKCPLPPQIDLKAVAAKVLLHTPCTCRNVLKTQDSPAKLLAQIPQLTVTKFTSEHCCGAAGTYMLDHPTLAEPLVDNLLSELDDIQVDFIATSNVGCALQIQQQLRILNPNITVCHPVTLLAKALGIEDH